jgi:hypothetical protein
MVTDRVFPEASIDVTLMVYTRPSPVAFRSARTDTSNVPLPLSLTSS